MAMTMDEKDVARVIRVQQRVRYRLARRRAAELAHGVYRKCYDSVSGFGFYCNLRTGGTSWLKPTLLGSNDAEWIEADKAEEPQRTEEALERPGELVKTTDEALAKLNSKEWNERFQESIAFQTKCRAEKLALQKRHRRKIARAMRDWDQKRLAEKQQAREQRLAKLADDNLQRKQNLHEGRARENTESIREAALRGHIDRIQELLAMGFSPDAESAMGLTPLLAGCQSGHVDVVKLLLANRANVNHRHVKTGRTALMEACSRTSRAIVKQLLRYGARIHLRDANGETVFDDMKDPGIQNMIARACDVWTVENAALFPADFRHASLTLALIGKRQHAQWQQEKNRTRRELTLAKQAFQRKIAETRVSYDELLRHCNMAPSVLKKLSALEDADNRFDSERRSILTQIQAAVDSLRHAEQPRFLTERVICRILSFCSRHWFERAHQRRSRGKKDSRKVQTTRVCVDLNTVPTRLRAPPDQLPDNLFCDWELFLQELQVTRTLLSEALAVECFDSASGVSRTAEGISLAELDVYVVEAENLPWRDPRTEDMMDPLVRVYLRAGKSTPESQKPAAQVFDSSIRIGTRDPVWDFHCRIKAVPSIHCDLVIQIVDQKRNEPAGDVCIPLRSLLNQREHDLWLIIPPTLRQQVLERSPRVVPARLHAKTTLSHTKSLVLTRELQMLLKTRDDLLLERRRHIQQAATTLLEQLPG